MGKLMHASTDNEKILPDLILREGNIEDVPLILKFIRDLADYEKLPLEVTANEEILRQTLFGERKVAEVILAFFQDVPAGFCLFFHNYSTFLGKSGIYIEDIFVKPDLRNLGIGKSFLTFVAKLAVKRDCGRVEWSVLDWNKPAIDFYKKIGAVSMDEWTTFRLTGENLKNLAAGNK